MSITRAFTSRRVKQSLELRDAAEGVVSRSNTHKSSPSLSSIRNKISAPVQLISTTNMLSYNAPDIRPKIVSASSTSSSNSEESDNARSPGSPASTPPTSPDSPFPIKRASSPEPNHLSCYFTPPGKAAGASAPTEAPAIPTRAPSHTKKSYDTLTSHRSASRLSEQSSRTVSTKASFSFSRSSSTSTNTTTSTHRSASFGNLKSAPLPPITQTPLPAPPSPPRTHRKEPAAVVLPSHPFGNELAKVTELAEEFGGKGVSTQLLRQEEMELLNNGYKKLNPNSYLSEVQSLYTTFFADEKVVKPLWI